MCSSRAAASAWATCSRSRTCSRSARRPNDARTRAGRLVTLAALFAAAWPLAEWAAARWLVVECDMDRADAVVVLSGSSTYGERARHAAEIYAAGRAPLVVLTNDGQKSGWSA